MVKVSCGRQILHGEKYFYMERQYPERWFPFTSDYSNDDELRKCQEFTHGVEYSKDVIFRMCWDCAVKVGHVW